MSNSESLVVVHLSSTAVYVVIAQLKASNDIRVVGLSEVKTNDFYQGKIINFDKLKLSISQAVQEAEDMANCRIHSFWLSLSTPELMSRNSYGKVKVEDETVGVIDIVESLSQAKSRDVPSDFYLTHYTQQGIYVDDSSILVDNPIGTRAKILTSMYHLMMLPVDSSRNITNLFNSSSIRMDYMIFDTVSGAEFALIPEEKEQGVCFIDIGYSSTNVCVYKDNRLVFTSCLPHGGHEVTMDISAELGLSMLEAESLKKRHGTVDSSIIDSGGFITISRENSDEVTINLHELSMILEARYMEIYKAVFLEIDKAGLLSYLNRGVVLAGGGSLAKGMVTFSKRYLNMPVVLTNGNKSIKAITASAKFDNEEISQKVNTLMKNRGFETAFGTLLYSQSEQFKHSERSSEEALNSSKKSGKIAQFFSRLNTFLKDNL